jgi:Ni2+-binding GTPase involved in maturation of urease and hydrogenase
MHFVGGFLGSGKTTAIAGACRLLIAEGLRVGVVTNDQGKLQVDSLFMRSAGIPAVEVGGGCFCCRYDDFDEKVSGLVERERPDAVFAESVGSCADLVATVVKPFESFRERYALASELSVLADSRLLLARLAGKRLPFSEDVLYVFDRQLEEADLLVLNKRDLLGEADRDRLRGLAEAAWPGKRLVEVSGSTAEGAAAWLAAIEELAGPARVAVLRGGPALEIDYGRYGSGERELSWLDERLAIEDLGGLSSDGSRCRRAAAEFALRFAAGLRSSSLALGHLKLQVSAPGFEGKLSLTSGDFAPAGAADFAAGAGDLAEGGAAGALRSLVEGRLPPFSARRASVAVNARAQASPEELAAVASAAAEAVRLSCGVSIAEEERSAFRPGFPSPARRSP